MKAIVYHEHGSADVLRCVEIEKPVPGDDQVLIRICAAALNPLDRNLLKYKVPSIVRKKLGMPKPSITQPWWIGRDVAGVVEAVGKDVTQFKAGDEVFGVCRGSCAEYGCAAESRLALKPANVSFEEAASAPMVTFTALQGLCKGQLKAGQKILINGAAGGVGSFAVQIAKAQGAEVTGVCSTKSVDTVRSIGADHVIDYTQQDFTETGERYDMVFDCAWTHSWSASRRVVKPDGRFVIAGGPVSGSAQVLRSVARMMGAIMLSKVVGPRFVNYMAQVRQEDLVFIGDLMAEGKVKPVIDRRFTLDQVPEAIRYMEEGHARGKVVINVV